MLRSPNKRVMLKRKTGNIIEDILFWLSLFRESALSLFLFFISFFLIIVGFFSNKIPIDLNYIVLVLLVGLAIPTFIGLIRRFAGCAAVFDKIDHHTIWLVSKLIEFMKNTKLSYKWDFVIKGFFNRYPKNYGGIIIGGDSKIYLEQLTALIKNTEKSFYATLRGGKDYKYGISWFFEKNDKEDDDNNLSLDKRIQYLEVVNNNVKNLKNKKRIILFGEKELGDFCKEEHRSEYLRLNVNLDLFLADPGVIINYLVNTGVDGESLSGSQASFIWEDYAIFDDEIVIKHNGHHSLYLGMKNQIENMKKLFKLLALEPSLFTKIDTSGIYSYQRKSNSWDRLESNWINWTQVWKSKYPEQDKKKSK